jgi:CspA family cold shock protein
MARGTVKWFNSLKGYGFIQPQAGGKDVFVHISAVERAGLSGLAEGQVVEYEEVADKGKTSAQNLNNSSHIELFELDRAPKPRHFRARGFLSFSTHGTFGAKRVLWVCCYDDRRELSRKGRRTFGRRRSRNGSKNQCKLAPHCRIMDGTGSADRERSSYCAAAECRSEAVSSNGT